MFLGEYHTKFTGQGRIILPRKLREELSENKAILTRGFEGCVWGFSLEGWEKETKQQLEVSITEEKARSLRRYIFSASESVDLDAQGRFVIPKVLLDYGKLKDEVVIIGAGDHFEIWNQHLWKEQIKTIEEGYNG